MERDWAEQRCYVIALSCIIVKHVSCIEITIYSHIQINDFTANKVQGNINKYRYKASV